MEEGGFIAQLALIIAPPVFALAIFSFLPQPRAGIVLMFFGMLFLPERTEFDLPVFPPLGKHQIIGLWTLVCCFVWSPARVRRARIGRRRIDILVMIVFFLGMGTVLTGVPEDGGDWR